MGVFMKAKYFLLVVIILCFLGCGESKKGNTDEPAFVSNNDPINQMPYETPDLIGRQGYIISGRYGNPYGNERFDKYKSLPLDEWYIHPQKEVGPNNWQPNEDIKITHKTAVTVIDQNIAKSATYRWSGFYGTLTIKVDNQNYVIDYRNFTLNPYWEKGDIFEALEYGSFIGKFVGDQLPVDSDNKWVKIPQGELVLVEGKTGTRANVSSNDYPIAAFIYKEWRYGFGGVKCFFKPESIEYYY